MTPFACAQISKDRLRLWQKRNEKDGYACTPAILVNITHDERAGSLIVNTVEDLTDEEVIQLLRRAADELEEAASVKGN